MLKNVYDHDTIHYTVTLQNLKSKFISKQTFLFHKVHTKYHLFQFTKQLQLIKVNNLIISAQLNNLIISIYYLEFIGIQKSTFIPESITVSKILHPWFSNQFISETTNSMFPTYISKLAKFKILKVLKQFSHFYRDNTNGVAFESVKGINQRQGRKILCIYGSGG